MGASKLTLHTELAKDTAKHNDRKMYNKKLDSYDEKQINLYQNVVDKIDSFKVLYNNLLHYDIYDLGDNLESEKRFFEEHFSKDLEIRNKKYKKKGKKDKIKTIDEYRQSAKIYEDIIQVGSVKNDKSPSLKSYDFMATLIASNTRIKDLCESGATILNYDLHIDEASPHLHVRYVYYDEETNTINRKKVLAKNGYELPQKDKKESRHNNLAQAFTIESRKNMQESISFLNNNSCGWYLDTETEYEKTGIQLAHKTVNEYKKSQQAINASKIDTLKSLESELQHINSDVMDIDSNIMDIQNQIAKAKEEKRLKKEEYERQLAILKAESEALYASLPTLEEYYDTKYSEINGVAYNPNTWLKTRPMLKALESSLSDFIKKGDNKYKEFEKSPYAQIQKARRAQTADSVYRKNTSKRYTSNIGVSNTKSINDDIEF